MAPAASQNPRYKVNERPPFLTTLGYGLQFSLIASASPASAQPAAGSRTPVEAVQAEQRNVVARLSLCGQVGHDFAHHAAELESVARKPRRDKHVRKSRARRR